jgi:hypothetical protein
MFREMNLNDTVDKWIAGICGVMGGTVHLTLLATFNVQTLLTAILTAFFCGAAGVAGRHALNYTVKRWKPKKK